MKTALLFLLFGLYLGLSTVPARAQSQSAGYINPSDEKRMQWDREAKAMDAKLDAEQAARDKETDKLQDEVNKILKEIGIDMTRDLLPVKPKKTNDPMFDKKFQASRWKAFAFYPDCAEENSAFSKKMIEIANRLVEEKNDLVYSVDGPWIVATMAAQSLGVKPSKMIFTGIKPLKQSAEKAP